jgi:hypothetical protein
MLSTYIYAFEDKKVAIFPLKMKNTLVSGALLLALDRLC